MRPRSGAGGGGESPSAAMRATFAMKRGLDFSPDPRSHGIG